MPPAVAQAPIVTRCFDCLPHLADALGIVRGGDRSLDQREIVGPVRDGARRFGEIGDLDRAGERQQLVLAIEQRKLAAVAGGEFPDREPGTLTRASMSNLPHGEDVGDPVEPHDRPVLADEIAGRTGSGRTGRWRTSCCAPSKDRCGSVGTPASRSALTREAHHHFRPANHRDGIMRIEGGARNQRRHDADIAAPVGVGVIDGHLDIDIEALAPLLQLVAVEHIARDCGCRTG